LQKPFSLIFSDIRRARRTRNSGTAVALVQDVERQRIVLRISVIKELDDGTQLQLEGSLIGPWVEELRKQGEQALSKSKPVSLDLGKLWFVDTVGVALLRELSERGVACLNCSNFVSAQLKETNL
jgi:ABC-type transporter Mla MlaB component